MARVASNKLLQHAKKSKSDEFYTQLCDIESELQHYSQHFKNKVILCNCDDPRESNFFKFFYRNFDKLRIKKIITTCFKESGSGLYSEYTRETRKGKKPNILTIRHFENDGDFRRRESERFLEMADIVVSNPPFSLFREYVDQLVAHDKKFLIIGNINCITYKEVFKLIQENKAWLGVNLGRGISGFIVPDHYALYGTEARIDAEGNRIISPNNCLWLTNLDIPIRHSNIPLTKKYKGNEEQYPNFDNYKGINVNKTSDIPKDYRGAMGVPITFLHKFNPEQFEIIKFRKGNDDKDLRIDGKCPYFRILIKRKRQK